MNMCKMFVESLTTKECFDLLKATKEIDPDDDKVLIQTLVDELKKRKHTVYVWID